MAAVSESPLSAPPHEELLSRLPHVRGKLVAQESLANQTWFRVGGSADVMFRPADEDDLSYFLQNCPTDVPLTVIGVASNLLIRDGGIPGVVIKLGAPFARIKAEDHLVEAGSAAIDLNVARAAQVANIAGLEFLSGIPGTIGGGLRMNAGAYGVEFKDVVEHVSLIDRQGQIHVVAAEAFGFSYRSTTIAPDHIFLSATLRGTLGYSAAILARMQEIQKAREASQPIREKTGGSTFANPDDPQGRKAWQLIEAVDGRGLKIGHAKMSEKHCNFIVNTGQATAADIENLGEEIRRRVKEKFGIELRWEIKRLGVAMAAERTNECV